MKRFAVCLSVVFCGASLPTHAQGVYTKTGVVGAGLGYFHGVTDTFSLRTEFTTAGKFKHNFTSGAIDYRASLDADQLGVYGDWFPFGNGFRISGGVHARKLQAQAQGRPNANGQIIIHNTTVKFDPTDTLTGRVKFPALAPYLGIGWGYHNAQKPGLGFVLDVGVSFGKPSTSLMVSASLTEKLDAAAEKAGNTTAAKEIEGQRQKLADTVGKFKVFPQVYAGVSYRF